MPTSADAPRPRLALAGTSTFIGSALCGALAPRFVRRILTRSPNPQLTCAPDEVRSCDHFSRKALKEALAGVDYAIYLVHNRDPSARLDQAQSRDMDLLVADNFAWAAAQNGVKQILCRAPLLAHPERPTAQDALELEAVLSSHGVPLTVLRTGLVVAPGGELPRLLRRLVRRLPFLPLPALAERPLRPLDLASVLAAFDHCVANPDTFGGTYDVFGPEPVTLRQMLAAAARLAGRPARHPAWEDLPEAMFASLVRLASPGLHPDFLTYLMDMFSAATHGAENPVQAAATRDWRPFAAALEAALTAPRPASGRLQRRQDDEAIRQMRRVRSIQRLKLPEGRNAAWVAERYFPWLGTLLRLFVRTERDADGSWTVHSRLGGVVMLRLDFQPGHSTPARRMYFITGGALAAALGGQTARLEFRDLLGGRVTLFAIHDFAPALPWRLYRVTQAVVHGLVMKGFQGYLEQVAEGDTPL